MRFLMTVLLAFASAASFAEEEIRHYFEALNAGYSLPVHGDYLVSTEELRIFYQKRNYQPVWYRNGKLIQSATDLYLAVETVTADGLQPEDYHNRALQESCPAEQNDHLAFCDLLFSDAFFLLAQDLLAGKVNPATLEPGWEPQQRRRNLVLLLENALAEDKVKDVLANLRPAALEYDRLMASLRRLRAATRYPEWSTLATTPAIGPGQADERLTAIVDRLVFWGDMPEPTAPVKQYDEATQQAVKFFQSRHGLEPTGIIGPETLEHFNVTPTRRAQQIMVNMERWRWLDENLGPTYVLVNLAASELEAVRNTQTAFTKPIAVSALYRDAPLFSDRLRYMVMNPGWTVPRQIAAEEQLALIQQDPQYLSRLGFSVFSGTTLVPPESVDWSGLSPANFDYRLVQSPGPRNALGKVKFMFPNKHHVYLHGAPAEDLFTENKQGFRAGSIRVESPLELAAWLLEEDLAGGAQVQSVLSRGAPEAVYLRQPIPVHLAYRTAWVNSQGVLNFRPDIYERDMPLYEALIKAPSVLDGKP